MKNSKLILVTATMALMATLVGCGKDNSGTSPDDPTPDNPSSKTHTVTFVSNGGSAVDFQTVAEGEKATEPTAPTQKDYTFGGWFTDNNTFTDKWDFATRTVTTDISLYAKWLDASGGTVPGTGAIEISTADGLNNVRNNLSGSYILMNDISLSAYSADKGWMPIGTNSAPFTGKFDGNGHKITGLSINRPTEQYAGLFGCIYKASVGNLGVEIAEGGINGGNTAAGGIAAIVNSGTITNCYSKGNITATSNSPADSPCSGGIAGWINSGTIITDCYSAGNIYAISCAGGIVGYVYSISGSNDTIINSYSTGSISSNGYSGGIVGCGVRTDNFGIISTITITNCYSTGGISSSNGDSGGIIGCEIGVNSKITDCYSTGDITSSGGAGGIAGSGTDIIKNCYSSGNINAVSCAGGITSRIDKGGTIINCYSTGNVSAASDVGTGCYSGGITGWIDGSTITNCYSTGNISASAYKEAFSGGIAGYIYANSVITNCVSMNATIKGLTTGRIVYVSSSTSSNTVSNNFTLSATPFSDVKSNGINKTLTQLQTKTTYSNTAASGGLGWAFDGNDDDAPWKMPDSVGYPVFYWQ